MPLSYAEPSPSTEAGVSPPTVSRAPVPNTSFVTHLEFWDASRLVLSESTPVSPRPGPQHPRQLLVLWGLTHTHRLGRIFELFALLAVTLSEQAWRRSRDGQQAWPADGTLSSLESFGRRLLISTAIPTLTSSVLRTADVQYDNFKTTRLGPRRQSSQTVAIFAWTIFDVRFNNFKKTRSRPRR